MSLNFIIPEMQLNGAETSPLQFFRRGFLLNGTAGSGPSWQDIVLSGNGSLTLTNAKKNSLSYLKLFGECEQNGTPTPTVPIDIVCNNGAIKYSLNMANVNAQTALVGYYISSSGVVTADVANWIYQNYIPVEPSTTYTLTISTSVYYVSISEYSTTDDSGFIIRKAGTTGSNTTLTITTSSNTNYIRFGTNIDRTEVTLNKVLSINWMLNKGNSLPYAPYSPNGIYTNGTIETVEVDTTGDTATAEMLLKVGDYQDKQNVTNGHITRNVGIKVLDGTENWKSSVTSKFYLDNDYMRNYNSTPIFCTHYKAVLASGTSGVGFGEIGLFAVAVQGTSPARLVVGDDNYTSVDNFKAYLSQQYQAGTPVIVVYPIRSATTESVAGQHLSIKSGTNTITITQSEIDNLQLEVSYKGKGE